jgi:nucleotide-binding universal stress UspA family protein
MAFKRVLIAVDDSPIAAHAANVGFELAQTVQGDAALITVVDPSQLGAPESGIPAADLIASAEQDGRRLLTHIGARSGTAAAPQVLPDQQGQGSLCCRLQPHAVRARTIRPLRAAVASEIARHLIAIGD